MIRIPPPEFLIFYNGKEELPDRTVLNLSNMYEKKDPHAGLELSAVMLNISGKHNQKLKEACTILKEYAIYTDKVRKYVEEMELADAVEQAIRECIAEGVLKDFLEKHRAEAKEMNINPYLCRVSLCILLKKSTFPVIFRKRGLFYTQDFKSSLRSQKRYVYQVILRFIIRY